MLYLTINIEMDMEFEIAPMVRSCADTRAFIICNGVQAYTNTFEIKLEKPILQRQCADRDAFIITHGIEEYIHHFKIDKLDSNDCDSLDKLVLLVDEFSRNIHFV